jgi:hypothetical protein
MTRFNDLGLPAFQFDVGQAHGEFSILGVISEQPTFQLLPHHRSFDREMERGRSARIQRPRLQFGINCLGIINHAEPRTAG